MSFQRGKRAEPERGIFDPSVTCPQCQLADLEEYGSKMRCPRCFFILPCCETDEPARLDRG